MKSIFAALLFTFLLLATSTPLQAESTPVDSLNKKLYSKSNKYTEHGTVYRVVKWETLKAYFGDVKALDTEKSKQITTFAQEIQGLEKEKENELKAYGELNDKYDHAVKVNDAMEFFTLLIPKAQYNLMMWSIVCILIVGIVILYLMFNRGHQSTRSAKKELQEKIEEFESYRKRTLKREQEVASGYLRDIKKLKEQIGNF